MKRVCKDFDLYVQLHDEHLKGSFLKKICNSTAKINFYRKEFKVLKEKETGTVPGMQLVSIIAGSTTIF